MALGTYFFTIEAIRHRKHRKIAIVLVAWGLLYAVFLNTGRTGYVVLIIAAVMLLAQLAPRRFWLPGAALIIVAVAAFTFLSPRMHERMMGVGRALEGAAPITAGSQAGGYKGNTGHQAPDPGQMDLSMMRGAMRSASPRAAPIRGSSSCAWAPRPFSSIRSSAPAPAASSAPMPCWPPSTIPCRPPIPITNMC